MFLTAVLLLVACAPAVAQESDGCLNCHQYRGLARIDTAGNRVKNFFVDPDYYTRGLGPHARLRCTQCHDDKEVGVFPHEKVAAVDCTKACHLVSGNREVRFSHEKVKDTLKQSVHTPEVLRKSNEILGSPLSDGQARCLLCHDEPKFSRATDNWAHERQPVERCNNCHTDELKQNTQFSFWHVTSRAGPTRSQQETVALCGMCHSDRRIQKAFDLPDATASFLASFHGKAVLLGNTEAAGCMNCHVSSLQSVHLIRGKGDPLSSTSPAQIAATCRAAGCHPMAGVQISSASVHLNLPTSRGVEFLIACIFVILIATTFGPSLFLCAMELFRMVVGREDKHHKDHVNEVRELLANPVARERLKRFTPHQRVQHWFLVICFATLCITGFPIKFADRAWAAWTIERLGGLSIARQIHHWAGAILIAGFFYHLIYVLIGVIQQKRRTGKSLWRIGWDLPMMVRPSDAKGMLMLVLFMVGLKKEHPKAGRFNPEEKFEYIGVFWGTFVLGVTGVLMWANAWTTRAMPGRALTIMALLHTFEAFLALLHVGIVHMASVILSPAVFPVSPAMFTGDTPAEELAEGHSEMVEQVYEEVTHKKAPGTEGGHV